MAGMPDKSAELVGRLDRLPFSRWHRNLFTLCFLGVMFDACDFALFGMALPPVAREFGLNQAEAGLLATVGLIGAFLGALFWGTISDYIGRRTSFTATVGIFSVFTGLVAVSWNVLSLSMFRFLSNFGLGGEVPVALTLTSEYSPSRIRGRMTGTMMAAFPLGLALAALISYFIIPTYGWRAVFVAGVAPAALLFFVRMFMPESVRYLISRGRIDEAERTVADIERRAAEGRELPPVAVTAAAGVEERGVTVFELLTPERRRRTILLWIVSFCFLWASNGIIFMLPTILVQRGFALKQILVFLFVQAVAACVGYTACGFLIDRFGRRPVLFAYYFIGAFCPPVVRRGDRPMDLLRHRRGRLGQSGRLRLERNLCQRALSDPSAGDGGRLVLRHRPHRLVPRAHGRRLHAVLGIRPLRAAHLRAHLPDRVVRAAGWSASRPRAGCWSRSPPPSWRRRSSQFRSFRGGAKLANPESKPEHRVCVWIPGLAASAARPE